MKKGLLLFGMPSVKRRDNNIMHASEEYCDVNNEIISLKYVCIYQMRTQ